MSDSRIRLNSEGMSDEGQKLLAFLLKNIKGQDSAVKDIVEADELFRSGLYANDRPIYSALLLGPSGVGKTLTAEVLADYWFGSRSAFTKISCETMSESHGIASLVGSPPGYVGFNNPNDPQHPGVEPILSQYKIDEPDYLTPEVTAASAEMSKLIGEIRGIHQEIADLDAFRPEDKEVRDQIDKQVTKLRAEATKYQLEVQKLSLKVRYTEGKYRSIILFDEIEKGNETLHNLLLNIIDKGQLTLKNGMKTDFTKSIILMTSNIGSKEIAGLLDKKEMGFSKAGSGNEDMNRNIYRHAEKAARGYFRPELLGRLNRISVFRPLTREVMRMILDSELARFQESILKTFPIAIRISEDVKLYLLDEAMDRQQEGARLLRHKIDSHLREPFSRLKLRKEIRPKKDMLDVVLEDGKIVFYKLEK